MNIKRMAALALALTILLSCGGCAKPESLVTSVPTENTEPTAVSGVQNAVVEGFDWGPAVTKTILTLDQTIRADSVNAESFSVTEIKQTAGWGNSAEKQTAEASRKVLAAYTCDEAGNASSDTNRIALELSYSRSEGSPYFFNPQTWANTVCDPYELRVSLTDGAALVTETGAPVTALIVPETIDLANAIYPQLEGVDLTGTFTGTDGKTLTYGSYAPAADGQKHPLVIWLHGAGEGGTDPSIAVLGNKVTALYGEEFQTVMGGAYVLTPQTPTFWMQYAEDSWSDNPGKDSIYLGTLMELIQSHVAENPNIDSNRIYVGGCSNGGFMTMDLILNYPDYFAAAFPICEAYPDAGITDAQLEGIKDLPVWFVYARNDTTVDPEACEAPTIARLEAMGADVHSSVFDDVGTYLGHWSWIWFFNNACEENGTNMWQWLSEQSR